MAAKSTTSPRYCIKCMQRPKPITSSSFQITSKQRCTCRKLCTTSSSSVSTMSEGFPIKLKLNAKHMGIKPQPKMRPDLGEVNSYRQQQTISVPNITPRPERLQPLRSVCSQQFLTPNSPSNTDDYYSCASEESEDSDLTYNTIHFLKNVKGAHKNQAILQLLHEVVHLINDDNSLSEEALRLAKDHSVNMAALQLTHTTTQTKEIVCVPLNQSGTSNTQSSLLPPNIPSTAVLPKQEDFKPTGNFASEQQQPPPPPPRLTLPPWTHYCYFCGMALAQGQPMPLIPYPIDNTNNAITSHLTQGQVIPNDFLMGSNTGQIISNFPTIAKAEVPESFVYQETEEAYEEPKIKLEIYTQEEEERQNKLEFQSIRADFTCICPKRTDICPKHGPLTNVLKDSGTSCICFDDGEICELGVAAIKEEQAICICPTEEEECPIHGRIIKPKTDNKDQELHTRFVKNEEHNPSDNYVSRPKLAAFPDDDELLWGEKYSKPIEEQAMKLKANSSEKEVDEELHPRYVEKEEPYDTGEKYVTSTEEPVEELDLTKPASYVTPVYDDKIKEITVHKEVLQVVQEIKNSPYIVRTSATTGNIYNFLPVLDRGEVEEDEYYEQDGRYDLEEDDADSLYLDEECEELDEEWELAKERRAESRKKKKHNKDDSSAKRENNENRIMALATMQQLEGEGSREEMKFFIDSLILDLDAMEHARRKSAVVKNLCMPGPGMCPRESFPVTITDVSDLGSTSLYVKWIIHDCCGIGGYEIYTDGYLTNRYFHCKHEAAVITNVDVTLPHKITLMAQTSAEDDSLALMCSQQKNKNKIRSLPWKPEFEKEKKSCPGLSSSLWTPSIFLYDPATCRALVNPPIMRGSI